MGEMSFSRRLAAEFTQVWEAGAPDPEVTYVDLAAETPPPLDADAVMAFYLPAEARSPRQQRLVDERLAFARPLLDADAVLISVPMHNWSIGAHLKLWLDQVLIEGVTLFGDGAHHPLAGVPVSAIVAYGGGYSEGSPRFGWDHAGPLLRTIFDDVMQTDFELFPVELTLVNEPPELAALGRRSREAAGAAIAARAADVAARPVLPARAA